MQAALKERGLKGVLGAVLAGIGAALCMNLSASPGGNIILSLLACISPVCIFLAGLGGGIMAAIISSVVAILAMSLYGQMPVVIHYSLTLIVPAAIVSILALRYRRGVNEEVYWYPSGYLLLTIVMYFVAAFGVALVMTSNMDGGMRGVLEKGYDMMSSAVMQRDAADPAVVAPIDPAALPPGMDAATAEKMKQVEAQAIEMAAVFFKKYLPAIMMMSFIIMLTVSGIVAQIALRSVDWALRADFGFADFILPRWLLALVGGSVALAFIPDENLSFIGANVAPVLLLPFFVLGLAVVHAWAATQKHKVLWLVIFYVVLSFGWPAILAVGLGITEQFFNIRQRLSQPKAAA